MRGNARRTTRAAAYVASAGLAISGTLLAVTPAQSAPPPATPAAEAATWLDGQLTGGLMHNPNFGGFDDYGLSVDTGFALTDIGGHSTAVSDIKDALADHVDDYVTPFGGPHSYTGSLAKLAAFVGYPADTSFGSQNLVTQLEARVASAAPIAGRLQDTGYTAGSQFDDDAANVLGQAYAAAALSAAHSSKADAVTDFLLKQQCSSGYFRLNFTSSKTATNQSCTNGTDPADPDATAIAVLFLASQSSTTNVGTAITKAKSWLVDQQRCDGSFGGGPTTTGSNANSTGVIAWALGDSPASRQAATWLRAHQATSADSGNSLASQTGAIAYDDAALAAGRTNGITTGVEDQWRRATSQAAIGIKAYSASPTPAISLTGPASYLKARSNVALQATGADVGTVLCVTGPGASTRGIAAANGLKSTVTLPAGTATRVYTLTDPFGHKDTQALKVLGAKKLTVAKSRAKVKRGRVVLATLKGLAPGETARIYYKGALVRQGVAGAKGNFLARFDVGRAKGKKWLTGYGQFSDIRSGATRIKVVR